jgi:AraC-like DNA-binding protein
MFYSAYNTPFHSHNTLQLVFGLGGNFRLRTKDTCWRSYKSLVIRENIVHRLDTCGGVQLIIYVDAESPLAEAIRTRYLTECELFAPAGELLQALRPGDLQQCLIRPDKGLLEQVTQRILVELQAGKLPEPGDIRVRKAMSLVDGETSGEITICQLARSLFVSESRLRSIFRSGTGISLHKYILLHKIILAIGGMMNGATISEAAIKGGFADSSHFHKVLLHLVGTSPSQFIRDNSKKNIERAPGSLLRLVTNQYDDRTWEIANTIIR